MYEVSHHALDDQMTACFDRVGLVGRELRERLGHELKAKLVMSGGRDPVEVVGSAGAGKHKVVEAAHAAATELLGRRGPRVNLDCGSLAEPAGLEDALARAMRDARDGTLVLDRFGKLGEERRRAALSAASLGAGPERPIVLTIRRDVAGDTQPSPAQRIEVQPLHAREEDIWDLIDHFFEAASEDAGLEGCRGFSRQSKADIAEVVRQTGLASVRRLREIVRELVFEAASVSPAPLKVTSELVRPWLEQHCGQTTGDRQARDAALVASQFDALAARSMVERFSELHGVPAELIQRQADLVQEIIGYIDDVPRSYRNIVDRAEDIQRVGLWLVTGAETQADFRRFFGEERFMRPTKSVAWAFFNRVFKRDV